VGEKLFPAKCDQPMRTFRFAQRDGMDGVFSSSFFKGRYGWWALIYGFLLYRFSLAASLDAITGKPQGSEDFFSSDIPDESLAATFGKIPPSTKLLILFSGNDEFVPPSVDKEALVNKWKDVCEKNGITVAEESGVIPGAGHSVDGASDEVSKDFLGRVRRFLKHL
jgi:hypothetical protein